MSQHNEIRDLLALAATGALNAAEQRQFEQHLRECPTCRAELDSWQQITAALSKLPTPQAPSGLVERTRRQLIRRADERKQRFGQPWLMAALILFAWTFTLLSWPLLQIAGHELVGLFDIPSSAITLAWIVYTIAAWLATGVVAGFVGRRSQREGRTI